MTTRFEVKREEASIIRSVFDWIHFDPSTSKFVYIFHPKFFATSDTYKLALGIIENMNKHVSSNEHERFTGDVRAWDTWNTLPSVATGTTYCVEVHLLETAVLAGFSYQVITLPFDGDDPLRETNQAISFGCRVNGKFVEFDDSTRVSEAARCVLTLPYIRDQMKGFKHG